jgi:ESCRT-II complex subunit VPS36
MRRFLSGLTVLHTPEYTHAAFAARLVGRIGLGGPVTSVGVAREEGLAVGMVGEMIGEVEREGGVCRDEGASWLGGGGMEVRWCENVFTGYVWDGQEDE